MLPHAIADVAERIFGDTPVAVSLQTIGTAYLLPTQIEHQILRIAQEALTNVLKHAHASQVEIKVMYSPEFCLQIRDDGQGFDINQIGPRTTDRFGVRGMQERADRIGGCFKIASQVGLGTTVQVTVPCKPALEAPYH